MSRKGSTKVAFMLPFFQKRFWLRFERSFFIPMTWCSSKTTYIWHSIAVWSTFLPYSLSTTLMLLREPCGLIFLVFFHTLFAIKWWINWWCKVCSSPFGILWYSSTIYIFVEEYTSLLIIFIFKSLRVVSSHMITKLVFFQ